MFYDHLVSPLRTSVILTSWLQIVSSHDVFVYAFVKDTIAGEEVKVSPFDFSSRGRCKFFLSIFLTN